MSSLLESLVGVARSASNQGKIVGYTDSGKLLVSGASGESQMMSNATGRTLAIGSAVITQNNVVTGSDGSRDAPETVYLRG